MSRQRIVLAWEPDFCRHCFGCTVACLKGALTVDHDRGCLSYDIRKCIRCGNCVRACYTGALHTQVINEP